MFWCNDRVYTIKDAIYRAWIYEFDKYSLYLSTLQNAFCGISFRFKVREIWNIWKGAILLLLIVVPPNKNKKSTKKNLQGTSWSVSVEISGWRNQRSEPSECGLVFLREYPSLFARCNPNEALRLFGQCKLLNVLWLRDSRRASLVALGLRPLTPCPLRLGSFGRHCPKHRCAAWSLCERREACLPITAHQIRSEVVKVGLSPFEWLDAGRIARTID